MSEVHSRFTQPHERNERITIFWPGGPYNFVIEFHYASPGLRRGWMWIRGFVVEPNAPENRMTREFYVQPVKGGYSLVELRG
jgi:hypothetical protein